MRHKSGQPTHSESLVVATIWRLLKGIWHARWCWVADEVLHLGYIHRSNVWAYQARLNEDCESLRGCQSFLSRPRGVVEELDTGVQSDVVAPDQGEVYHCGNFEVEQEEHVRHEGRIVAHSH